MIRHTAAHTTLLHTPAPAGNRRNVGSFGALLSPNVPTGSVPVPPDAETLHAQPDETERLDLHRVGGPDVPDGRPGCNHLETAPSAPGPADAFQTASAGYPISASDFDPAGGLVEVRARTQDGNIEIVAFPWHLCANNQLSWSSIAAELASATPSASACAISFGQVHAARIEAGLPLVGEASSTPDREIDALANVTMARTIEDAGVSAASPGAATRPLPGAMWASRLVRWLEQHGMNAELWIRDFSLDDASARALALDIKRVCRRQGIQLDRIVVNARTQWTAPARTPSGEN